MVNKLEDSVAIHRLMDFTPKEKLTILGFGKKKSDRSFNRTVEYLGENSQRSAKQRKSPKVGK